MIVSVSEGEVQNDKVAVHRVKQHRGLAAAIGSQGRPKERTPERTGTRSE